MDTLWPEQIFSNQPKLIEKLVKGKESADKLRTLLQQPFENNGSVSAEELAVKILTSFTDTLSLLRFSGSNDHEMFRIDGSDERNKIKPLGVRERRGCYRRRNVSESRIKVSPTVEDGYAWRKYGQKDILNTKYPRCYFRCTHKYDQGCKATKQVQVTKQDPHLLYQITYFGHHTCNDTLRAPQIITELDPIDSSCLLSFQFSNSFPPITATTMKPQPASDTFSSSACKNSSSSSSVPMASCLWPDRTFTSEVHREEVVSSGLNSNSSNNANANAAADGDDDDDDDDELLRDLDMEDFTKLDDLYFDDNDFLLGIH